MGIAILSASPALAALFVPATRRLIPHVLLGWLLALFSVGLFGGLLTYLPHISESGAIYYTIEWLPAFGVNLSLYLDGLSLLFSLVITGVGAAVLLYAGYYFEDAQALRRFYALLLTFMSAMLALVLAGNLITLFIAWEATSIVSFLLISFYSEDAKARSGALQALMITGGGGLALLVGLLMFGYAAGTIEFPLILTSDGLRDHPLYAAFTLLILLGCFSKSAQFPLHFWLPGAMSAPTPASAYLHSATMVKAGVYLLIRLSPVLGDTALWESVLLVVGLLTMGVGALLALRQSDLKACLAYSTVSQLGAFVALIGLPHGEGLEAVYVGIIAHSQYKAALFLIAGAVDHAAGTRDLKQLGGLARAMPAWAIIAGVAGLSMAGLPPLLGFVAKEALIYAMLSKPLAVLVVVGSAALTVTMALILVWDVFMGARHDHAHEPHAPGGGLLIAPSTLSAGSLLAGLGLNWLIIPLIAPMLHHEVHLSIIPALNTPFLLSMVAVLGGAGLFAVRRRWRALQIPQLPNSSAIYQTVIDSVGRAGDQVLKSQGGKIRHYLFVILLSVSVLMATAGLTHLSGRSIPTTFNGGADLLRVLLLVLSLGAMLASILFKQHLLAALSLGVAGYSVGALFLLEPAPDVALVQFMVETLGTVLLIVMLGKISAAERQRAMQDLWDTSRLTLLRDIALSAVIGGGVALFALAAVLHRPAPQTIATWHLENAYPMIGITDVVGAIVTDFRGMDTIIEITVLSMAALGVHTILSVTKPAPRWPLRGFKTLRSLNWRILRTNLRPESQELLADNEEEERARASRFDTPLTRTAASLTLPFAFLIALGQLFYGGDAPGDGFTAGVIMGLGVALWYVVFGYHESRERLRWVRPRGLIGTGVALVVLNAAFPLVLGLPFLAHLSTDWVLPANLHFSSTFVYETGICLSVFGSSSLILETIAHPREVQP